MGSSSSKNNKNKDKNQTDLNQSDTVYGDTTGSKNKSEDPTKNQEKSKKKKKKKDKKKKKSKSKKSATTIEPVSSTEAIYSGAKIEPVETFKRGHPNPKTSMAIKKGTYEKNRLPLKLAS